VVSDGIFVTGAGKKVRYGLAQVVYFRPEWRAGGRVAPEQVEQCVERRREPVGRSQVLAIIVLLVTRARGRPLEPARLLVGPLLLIAIGIGSSTPALHGATLHGATLHGAAWHGIDYLIVGLDLLDSLLVGTIRGFTVRLYQRDGAPWYRYGPVTIALWLLSILIRVGLVILGAAHHASPLAEGSDLLFMLGLALLCQNVVVVQRYALRQRACGWR
jgi:hypothetical protein